MPWFKVDDTFPTHPKVMEAGNAAIGLWVRAGAWSAQHLTDGHIPKSVLPLLGGTVRDADRLTAAGLWTKVDKDVWQFHDWGHYQPSRVRVMAGREANRVRQQRGRERQQSRRDGDRD